jgi:hypothetical protein
MYMLARWAGATGYVRWCGVRCPLCVCVAHRVVAGVTSTPAEAGGSLLYKGWALRTVFQAGRGMCGAIFPTWVSTRGAILVVWLVFC